MDRGLIEDLGASGLTPEDIRAREAGPTEFAGTNTNIDEPAYVIPYFDVYGEPLQFYRLRFPSRTAHQRYKQVKGEINHVYFPPDYQRVLKQHLQFVQANGNGSTVPYIIITEGEKKAAYGVKCGYPTVAFGGVDSWRTRTLLLPGTSELQHVVKGDDKKLHVKLKGGNGGELQEQWSLAQGMQALMDLIKRHNLTVFIAYDSDAKTEDGLKPEVQRAAARLGYEMRYYGIPGQHVRLLTLPPVDGWQSTKLDDYLLRFKEKGLDELIRNNLKLRSAFPRHPDARAYITKKLDAGMMTRKGAQETAFAVLAELDARGRRLRDSATGIPFYFDEVTHQLMPAAMLHRSGEPMHESTFGTFLYKEFGLNAGDVKVVQWLAAQFTGEDPIDIVTPKRVIARPPGMRDALAYQISDSHFALITPDPHEPIKFVTNGSYGVLFEQNQVEPLDLKYLKSEIMRQQALPDMKPWWGEVMKDVHIPVQSDKDMFMLLFYISPWLWRWRDTQLPVELFVGEAGSGKSTLVALRLSIISGRPTLRNMPNDIKDWRASVVSTGGLHVIDNVHMSDKGLRQQISDEICRIVTEPDPHIEMRQLYTTNQLVRVPVQVAMAYTSINQPFPNPDIIQRSVVAKFEAIESDISGDWGPQQVKKYGGREAWIAHHLVFLERLFKMAIAGHAWDASYRATNRLVNFEQLLKMAARIFDMEETWIPQKLAGVVRSSMKDADWALDALGEFAEYWERKYKGVPNLPQFTANDIHDWVQANEDHQDNHTLNSVRKLGRYLQQHRDLIFRGAGMRVRGVKGNRKTYTLDVDQRRVIAQQQRLAQKSANASGEDAA